MKKQTERVETEKTFEDVLREERLKEKARQERLAKVKVKLPEDFTWDIELFGKIYTIKSHANIHADEAFPVSPIEYLVATDPERLKVFLEEYAPDGVLEFGVGRGRWDEHSFPEKDTEEEEGQTATSLFARDLGIDKDPIWEKILRFINLNDSKGSQNPRDIATLLKVMNFQNPFQSDYNIDWFLDGLSVKLYFNNDDDFTIDSIRQTQIAFDGQWQSLTSGHWETPEEWFVRGQIAHDTHQRMFECAVGQLIDFYKDKEGNIDYRLKKKVFVKKVDCDGKEYCIASVIKGYGQEQDFQAIANYRIGSALRFLKKVKNDVTIVKRSEGYLIIDFGRRVSKAQRENCISVIRMFEYRKKRKKGEEICRPSFNELKASGSVEGIQEWFYHKKLRMLFNGTATHPEIVETSLSFYEIINAIEIGLKDSFNPRFEKDCEEKCAGARCNFFTLGLAKCRTARFLKHQEGKRETSEVQEKRKMA